MKSWQKVFDTTKMHRAELVKDILIENDISAVVVNKKDSSYQIGHYEVQVNHDDVLKSIKIIKEQIHLE